MTTDVNAAFDATRADQRAMTDTYNRSAEQWNALTPQQRAEAGMSERAAKFEQRVADGKMTNLGNGRYRVDEPGSYDDGEIFQVQRNSTDARQLLVMPEHGLDTSAGGVAFYSRTPEWHQFGTIIPSGLSSIPAVLKAARINFNVLSRPAGGRMALDTEELRDAWRKSHGLADYTAVPPDVFVEQPGKFQNYRDDTLAGLGIVGKIFTAVQPAQSMAFLQKLVEDGSVIIESAGALDGGARIFISCLLPQDMVVDAGGIDDHVQLYVAVFDRFDGQGQFQAVCTPWRPRCRNTERLALAQAVTRWGIRHTTNALARVEEAQKTLGLSNKYAAAFVEEETALARSAMRLSEFDALLAEVWERDKAAESKKSATVADKREQQIRAGFDAYSGELGRTAYAAERAVTDWLDHAAPRRVTGDKMAAARATASFIGTDDDVKAAVHQKLMLRVR